MENRVILILILGIAVKLNHHNSPVLFLCFCNVRPPTSCFILTSFTFSPSCASHLSDGPSQP